VRKDADSLKMKQITLARGLGFAKKIGNLVIIKHSKRNSLKVN